MVGGVGLEPARRDDPAIGVVGVLGQDRLEPADGRSDIRRLDHPLLLDEVFVHMNMRPGPELVGWREDLGRIANDLDGRQRPRGNRGNRLHLVLLQDEKRQPRS